MQDFYHQQYRCSWPLRLLYSFVNRMIQRPFSAKPVPRGRRTSIISTWAGPNILHITASGARPSPKYWKLQKPELLQIVPMKTHPLLGYCKLPHLNTRRVRTTPNRSIWSWLKVLTTVNRSSRETQGCRGTEMQRRRDPGAQETKGPGRRP